MVSRTVQHWNYGMTAWGALWKIMLWPYKVGALLAVQ